MKSEPNATQNLIIGIVTFFVMFIYAPFITIWVINQLTKLNIQYTIWTWLAVQWLHIIIYFFRSNTSTVTNAFITTSPEKKSNES